MPAFVVAQLAAGEPISVLAPDRLIVLIEMNGVPVEMQHEAD